MKSTPLPVTRVSLKHWWKTIH